MKNINGTVCRHCLNKLLGTKLGARDCRHALNRCSMCGGEHSYYTVTNVKLSGKLKLIGKAV